MKIAKERGRGSRRVGIGLAALAMAATTSAWAQQAGDPGYQVPPPATRTPGQKPRQAKQTVNLHSAFSDVPGVKQVVLPVNPSDPIAIVNNQAITRQQLADECVAKEGKKILDAMIHRVLVEQALARQHLAVTAAEIDEEIDGIAARFGLSRDLWLRSLDKERGISPAQYAREIVYPAIALRKLCTPRVQVTPKDMQEAFDAQFGEKLRVRMIMVNNQQKAIEIWEQLHDNPGGFERVAKEQSMDNGSKSLGGLLAEPISRHSYPRNVSDGAFRQLVDGDPADRDPTHKPKDGDMTGPIQYDQAAWILLRREELIPANKNVDPKNKQVMKQVYDMIHEVKLREEMEKLFGELIKEAAIENRLTGGIKMANEELHPDFKADGDVNQTNGNDVDKAPPTRAAAPNSAGAGKAVKDRMPVALSPEAARQFRPLKPGGTPTTKAGTTSAAQQPTGGNATQPPAAGAAAQPSGGSQ